MRLVLAFSIFPALLIAQQPVVQASGWFQQGVNRQPQKPGASDCAVDGFVVNAISGAPVPRALVMLMGPYGQSSVSADNAGRWSFTNITCGQLQIMVSRPGFLPGNAGQPRIGAAFRPLILADGSSAHDVKVQLTPQGVVAGKVIDDQGDPVPNVQVSALASRVVQGRRTFQPGGATQTNDLGEFRLASLAGGRYIVCARGGNQFGGTVLNDSSMSGESCYPGPLEGGAASAMEIAAGSDTKIDFTLPRVPAVHVRGVVSGLPKGQGVGLNLVKRGVAGGGQAGVRPANIQPDGKFVITGVTPGSYMLNTDYFEAGKRLTARLPIEVGSSDVEGVTVHLEAGFSIAGTVRYESGTGGATPPGTQFNVNLHSSDGMAGGGGVQWNKDHTAFTVPDLPPGNYRLDGFVQGKWYLKSAMLGGRDLSREEIPIGQSAGPIDVVLSDDSGTVEGQVVDAGDQPVSSFVMIMAEGRQPHNVMSDAAGKFKVSGLAPGEYRAYAWDDDQQVEYADREWMRHYTGTAITIQADQTAQAKLTQVAASGR
jgi:hypothetical protein